MTDLVSRPTLGQRFHAVLPASVRRLANRLDALGWMLSVGDCGQAHEVALVINQQRVLYCEPDDAHGMAARVALLLSEITGADFTWRPAHPQGPARQNDFVLEWREPQSASLRTLWLSAYPKR